MGSLLSLGQRGENEAIKVAVKTYRKCVDPW